MTDAIVPSYTESWALSEALSKSNLLPRDFLGKPANVYAQVLTGQEFGLGPMQSIRGFDVIQGKVSMSSGMIGALIMSSPSCEYLTPVESTDKVATYETKRKGSPSPVRMSFTIEEAKLAGLIGKDNWKKNPTAMLLARAQARIGRAVYPDVCHGVYDRDSDELEVNRQPASVQSTAAVELKARIKAELTAPVEDAEIVEEPVPVAPSLADQLKAVTTVEELHKLLPAVRAAPAAELDGLKEVYRAKLEGFKKAVEQ